MTREQFSILVKGMKAIYSDPKFISDKDAFDVWYTFFADDDYMVVQGAIQKYMANNEFPPTVAGIRKYVTQLTTPEDDMSEQYAWALVYKAICNANYGAQKEFEKLPEVCRKSVGSPDNLREWAMLNASEVNTVIHSNFLRSFKSAKKSQDELASLPCQMREQILKITGTHMPTMIERGSRDD
jgi:hypothetical protein